MKRNVSISSRWETWCDHAILLKGNVLNGLDKVTETHHLLTVVVQAFYIFVQFSAYLQLIGNILAMTTSARVCSFKDVRGCTYACMCLCFSMWRVLHTPKLAGASWVVNTSDWLSLSAFHHPVLFYTDTHTSRVSKCWCQKTQSITFITCF